MIIEQELRGALEKALVREYGSLEQVPNNAETRSLLVATARDFINALDGDKGIVCRVELDGKLHIRTRVEMQRPEPLPIPMELMNLGTRNERRLATKKCKVVSLDAWKRAKGR